MFGDSQPETGASRFPGASYIDAVKALKDARLFGLRDANTRIRNGENDLAFSDFRAERDLPARKRVLNGVVQKVLQNFGEPPAVSGYVRQALRGVHGDAQIFFG